MSKPIRAKSLIEKTASECKMETELVGDVVDFFYGTLRKKLESLEEPRVSIPVLGTFIARRKTIQDSVNHLTKILTEKKPENFKKIKKYNLDSTLRDKQQVLLDKIDSNDEFKKHGKKNSSQQK
jgi:nucleoid DNA-binding protein